MMEGEKRAYILNLNGIIDFVFDVDDKKENNSEITDVYVMNGNTNTMSLSTRQIQEKKGDGFGQRENMRYDLVTRLLDRLMDIDREELGLGDSIVINTLLTEELITEIKDFDE